eukprot:12330-Heterococcus_DN1.PRE.1
MGASDEPLAPLMGVPSTVFVRVTDGQAPKGESIIDAGANRIDIAGRIYDADAVFDAKASKDDAAMFKSIMGDGSAGDGNDSDISSGRPAVLLALVDDAVSGCIIVTGTHGSGKREVYQGAAADASSSSSSSSSNGGGDAGDAGLIGWVLDPIFTLMKEKSFNINGYYEGSVTISFFEVYDEVISDLLQPANDDLTVKLHTRRGYVAHNLTKIAVASPRDALKAIHSAKRNRRTMKLPTGPAQHSTAAMFMIHLTQREGDSSQHYTTLHSTLAVVETPATNVLAIPPQQVVLRQGPTLHRSLLALSDVCKALSNSGDADAVRYAPFLQIANTELVQGLLCKYRNMLANVLEERAGRANNTSNSSTNNNSDSMQLSSHNSSSSIAPLIARLKEVESELLEAKLDLSTSRDDGAKVFKMLELFKQKYSALVESKAEQSRDLIAAEEGRLDISKALLDLKLEHSRLQEKHEAERYSIASELLSVKNEACDLELRLQEAQQGKVNRAKEAEATLEEHEKMVLQLKTLQEEAKSVSIAQAAMLQQYLRSNRGDLTLAARKALELEEAKSVELSSELLTLANQKAALDTTACTMEKQDCSSTLLIKHVRVHELTDRLQAAEVCLRTVQAELLHATEEASKEKVRADNADNEKNRADLQLQRLQIGLEKKELYDDQKASKSAHDRESELLQAQVRVTEDLVRLRDEETKSIAVTTALRADLRKQTRRVAALELDLQRRTSDLSEAAAEHIQLKEQLASLRDRFTGKLADIIGGTQHSNQILQQYMQIQRFKVALVAHPDADRTQLESVLITAALRLTTHAQSHAVGAGHVNNRRSSDTATTAANSANTGAATTRQAVAQLVEGCRRREDTLVHECEEQRRKHTKALSVCRKLYDKLQDMKALVEDTGAVAPLLPTEEDIMQSADGAAAVDSSGSSSSSSSNATLHAEEVATLREKLRLVQSDLTAQQERNINIIEEYQGLLRGQELQSREAIQALGLLRQENAAIKAELASARDGSGKVIMYITLIDDIIWYTGELAVDDVQICLCQSAHAMTLTCYTTTFDYNSIATC